MELSEMRNAVNDVIEAERRQYAPEPEPEPQSGQEPEQESDAITSDDILKALARNEDGDAELFIRLHRGNLVYDHTTSVWYVWDGHHWTLDTREEALSRVAKVANVYFTEMKRQGWARAKAEKAGQTKAADMAKEIESRLGKRIRDLQTIKRKQSVLHLARAGEGSLGISGGEWDADHWSLPVSNGVNDLRTGNFRSGEPSDYFKSYAPTPWQGIDAPCPTFNAFMNSTFNNDRDLVDFMGRLCGYAITGQTTEAVLPILWGAGRNGKTVLLQALADVLGADLAGPVEAEFLLETKFSKPSGGPSSDKLYLRGRRLTWLSETNENRRLNSGKVKLLTGGDIITGRAPYAVRQITFRPTHKIFLLTNHKPKADAQDMALWRRVLLIPFEMVFVVNPNLSKENERLADLDLAEKLRAEKSGILAWLVRGCLEWQRQGLNPPESVLAATKAYQDSEDTMKTFIAERCIEGPSNSIRAGLLYSTYKQWAETAGERPVTAKKFGGFMSDQYNSTKGNAGKFYIGIGLCDA